MKGDDLSESLANRFRDLNQFVRFLRRKSRPAMARPKSEPGLKMGFRQTERNVFHRHRAAVICRSASNSRPEVRNLFQVRRPVGDVGREDRRDLPMLPDIGVEIFQEFLDFWPAPDAFEQSGGGWVGIHRQLVG